MCARSPYYNHRLWPSPRAKIFVFGLHLATTNRITHDQALSILAKKIKRSVEDVLAMDPLTYLEKICEERYVREMTRYMSRRVLDDLIHLHNVHPRLSNLCYIQGRKDICDACIWEPEEVVADASASASASASVPLLETVLDEDTPVLMVTETQPLMLVEAGQEQEQKESKFFFDEDHFIFICQLLCFAIPLFYLFS
jgi:hypothetical protein